MATVNLNMQGFESEMSRIIQELSSEELFREPIFYLKENMYERIHIEGNASDGTKIGQYRDSYMSMRKRWKHPENERTVILVLTRKLQNSWVIFGTENGYAIGFQDEGVSSFIGDASSVTSLDKVLFAEQHFGKKIFEMTTEEEDNFEKDITDTAQQIIDNARA